MKMDNVQNTSVVLDGPNSMNLVESVLETNLMEGEVLLQMNSVGICGSDIKYWKYARCGRFVMDKPMVIGHEGSGTVVKTGPGVKLLQPGDRVAVEPGVPCRQCYLCHAGRYNLCADMRFCATPPVDGNLCRYFKHPADFCFKLPEHISMDEGALIEPMAVAVYACERAKIGCGSTILICGAGPVGLLCLLVAKASGADTVIITDVSPSRLELAAKLGADYPINVTQHSGTEDLASHIKSLRPVINSTIECSGVDSSMALGVHSTSPGGSVVMVGRGSMEPNIPLVKAATFEIDILGVFRYANCYSKAISLIASAKVDVTPLITHRFPLADSERAFETAVDPASGAVKVIIRCQ